MKAAETSLSHAETAAAGGDCAAAYAEAHDELRAIVASWKRGHWTRALLASLASLVMGVVLLAFLVAHEEDTLWWRVQVRAQVAALLATACIAYHIRFRVPREGDPRTSHLTVVVAALALVKAVAALVARWKAKPLARALKTAFVAWAVAQLVVAVGNHAWVQAHLHPAGAYVRYA